MVASTEFDAWRALNAAYAAHYLGGVGAGGDLPNQVHGSCVIRNMWLMVPGKGTLPGVTNVQGNLRRELARGDPREHGTRNKIVKTYHWR